MMNNSVKVCEECGGRKNEQSVMKMSGERYTSLSLS